MAVNRKIKCLLDVMLCSLVSTKIQTSLLVHKEKLCMDMTVITQLYCQLYIKCQLNVLTCFV